MDSSFLIWYESIQEEHIKTRNSAGVSTYRTWVFSNLRPGCPRMVQLLFPLRTAKNFVPVNAAILIFSTLMAT